MIRLDTLNDVVKKNWKSKTKFIESVILIKNLNNELHIEKINFRKEISNYENKK